MRFAWLCLVAGCAAGDPGDLSSTTTDVKLHDALAPGDFTQPIDRASIRALQTWLDDATFDTKWTTMISAPIELFGGADSMYHADLATLPKKKLPGHEVLCHGDGKFDNFGWTLVAGQGVFSDNDFDDADPCPVAADALRYLVATDLWFADPQLDDAALQAYVASVLDDSGVVAVDPTTEPDWADTRAKGLAKDTSGDKLVLGGEVQPALASEVAALQQLIATDTRLPPILIDAARDVRTDGGSAGWRRFWMLTDDGTGTRTIIELKEEGIPGPRFGRQHDQLDGNDRLDVLKQDWWDAADPLDHFTVDFLGSKFLVRDRLTRANPKPKKMTPAQITNMVQAEASMLGVRHRSGWGKVKRAALTAWLHDSAATLTARWRDVYTSAGGH